MEPPSPLLTPVSSTTFSTQPQSLRLGFSKQRSALAPRTQNIHTQRDSDGPIWFSVMLSGGISPKKAGAGVWIRAQLRKTMYKNQLQELAQRSCFGLPSYTCVCEGPDHAPRFRTAVNFNGEVFDSPVFWSTLRQAEHVAAEAALSALSHRGPSHSLAARVLDETGVYKNLLQEISRRVGASLPSYTTTRSGLRH